MTPIRIISLLCALFCLCLPAATAAEVDCDATYCFTAQDFAQDAEQIAGICITDLPDPQTGTVMLGCRVLRPGDILTAQQVAQMTFLPLRTQQDQSASVTYLPIYDNRVAPSATMTISIFGKEDKAPVAEDMAVETYKNLPNSYKLKASDPEGMALTYTVIRGPKRGQITLQEDGSFTYTPKKNKVGVDSFVYTATDPTGNVSREATVTVQILKPNDSRQYTDTVGRDCRFEAEWLRNSGLFTGESIGGQDCFYPDKAVSRGEFLAMLVKTLDIPLEETDYAQIPADVPMWLKPYVGAALRSGLLENWQDTQTFGGDLPITGAEAALLLQNGLELSLTQTGELQDDTLPVWTADSLAALAQNGISLDAQSVMTRGQTAQVLYQASILALTAPGTMLFRS